MIIIMSFKAILLLWPQNVFHHGVTRTEMNANQDYILGNLCLKKEIHKYYTGLSENQTNHVDILLHIHIVYSKVHLQNTEI